MGRSIHKLTPERTRQKSGKPGLHGDGGGLYLRVTPTAGGKVESAASWVYCYMLSGKAREMGLGSYPDISLSAARDLAKEHAAVKARGDDPLEVRKAQEAARKLSDAKAITFRECAEKYIAAHREGWRNEKHAAQWESTLETYAFPLLGDLPVQGVDAGLVQQVLEPIWTTKNETARRLRGRIEAVLDWAKVKKYRDGESNPAAWRGNLAHAFPKKIKSRRVARHHPALPYAKLPAFMTKLKAEGGLGASALEFVILTAARTGEAILAQWNEIDLDKALWTIPGERMKSGREHRVPLSKPALALLRDRQKITGGKGYVFPGEIPKRPISNMTMLKTLERMDCKDITVHGFRSTFRDWVEEMTSFPGSVAEAALGHVVGDKVEAAYRRGDLFDKRQHLMAAWGDYCTTAPAETAKVVPIRGKAREG